MEIFVLLSIFISGYFVGSAYTTFKLVKAIKEIAKEQGIDLEQEIIDATMQETEKNLIHRLNIEKHGDLLYLFNNKENKFICQGNNVQELANLAKQNNIIYAAVEFDKKVFTFNDGEIKEVL